MRSSYYRHRLSEYNIDKEWYKKWQNPDKVGRSLYRFIENYCHDDDVAIEWRIQICNT